MIQKIKPSPQESLKTLMELRLEMDRTNNIQIEWPSSGPSPEESLSAALSANKLKQIIEQDDPEPFKEWARNNEPSHTNLLNLKFTGDSAQDIADYGLTVIDGKEQGVVNCDWWTAIIKLKRVKILELLIQEGLISGSHLIKTNYTVNHFDNLKMTEDQRLRTIILNPRQKWSRESWERLIQSDSMLAKGETRFEKLVATFLDYIQPTNALRPTLIRKANTTQEYNVNNSSGAVIKKNWPNEAHFAWKELVKEVKASLKNKDLSAERRTELINQVTYSYRLNSPWAEQVYEGWIKAGVISPEDLMKFGQQLKKWGLKEAITHRANPTHLNWGSETMEKYFEYLSLKKLTKTKSEAPGQTRKIKTL